MCACISNSVQTTLSRALVALASNPSPKLVVLRTNFARTLWHPVKVSHQPRITRRVEELKVVWIRKVNRRLVNVAMLELRVERVGLCSAERPRMP